MLKTKRILSLILAVSLCLSMLIPCVSAQEEQKYATREYIISKFVQSVGRINLEESDAVLDFFSDAEKISPKYKEDVSRAIVGGIVKGYEDRTIRPDEPVSRLEAMVMLSRCVPSLEETEEAIEFTDVPQWAKEEITYLSKAGLVKGYGNGLMGAGDYITVEQVGLLVERSDDALRTLTPGDSFYGYVNEKTFRNVELENTTEIDPIHGAIITNEDAWSNLYDIYYDIIDIENELLEKIVNGEIKAEKGTPEQRVLDMLKCIDSSVAMDEDDIKYIKDIRSALVNAKTTEEFLNVVADIYKLAGINVLFDIDIDTDKKTGVPYPKFTITSAGFGGFLSFRTKTNTDEYNSLYKEIMVDYLDTIGAEFTDKEIDEAIKLQTVTCGDNDIYTAVISYLAFARMFDLVTDEEILAEVDDMKKLHPELFDESGEYLGGSSLYESKDREDADAAFSGFDLCDELSKYGFTNLEKIIIPVSKIAKEEKNVICEENLPALKINALIRLNEHLNISLNEEEDTAWSKISTFPLMVCLTKSAEELKEGLAETEDGEDSSAKETFSETTGVEFDEGLLSAVNLSKLGQLLPEDIGFIYVNHYYDDAISEVIGKMVQDIGSAYKKRFENNEWMSEETKKNAIKKLQNMLAVVGYPDNYTYPEIQSIEEGGSLFSNTLSIKRHDLSVLIRANEDKEFIRTKMFSPPDEVNAFYVFDYNTINIPAGILNPPVYDKDASYATNLGAIGMIIAHEIGHGFDEFGATFDENGCLNNWWTEEDYSEFMKIQEYFIEYYNQFEVVDGVVQDAKITIGENMADFAALQIIMDIVGDDKEAQKECFESYARMWAKLGTVNYLTDSYFMDDVHASNVVRVNAVVASFDQFYELYDVKEGDLMYVAPEKRLKLW